MQEKTTVLQATHNIRAGWNKLASINCQLKKVAFPWICHLSVLSFAFDNTKHKINNLFCFLKTAALHNNLLYMDAD